MSGEKSEGGLEKDKEGDRDDGERNGSANASEAGEKKEAGEEDY